LNEASLSRDLVETLGAYLQGSVVFKHNEQVTGGLPDLSVTFRGSTVWLEVKFIVCGEIIDRDLQWITARKLAKHGKCFYVLYVMDEGAKSIWIVAPKDLDEWANKRVKYIDGHDHMGVAKFVEEVA